MAIIVKGLRIDAIIVSKARVVVRAYFSLIVSIKLVDLSANRDLIFEPK